MATVSDPSSWRSTRRCGAGRLWCRSTRRPRRRDSRTAGGSGAAVRVRPAAAAAMTGAGGGAAPEGRRARRGRGVRRSDQLAAAVPDEEVTGAVSETDDALILCTSGTTGRPGSAVRSSPGDVGRVRPSWPPAACGPATGLARRAALRRRRARHHALDPGTMIGAKHVESGPASTRRPCSTRWSRSDHDVSAFPYVPVLLRLPDLADRNLSCWRNGLFAPPPCPRASRTTCHRIAAGEFIQLRATERPGRRVDCDAEQVKARPTPAAGRRCRSPRRAWPTRRPRHRPGRRSANCCCAASR